MFSFRFFERSISNGLIADGADLVECKVGKFRKRKKKKSRFFKIFERKRNATREVEWNDFVKYYNTRSLTSCSYKSLAASFSIVIE
jgi:hypothetical protein